MTTLANKIRKWQTWQNETKQSENNSRGVAVVTSRCLQSIPLRWTHPLTSPLLSRSPWWYRKRRGKSPKLTHKTNVLKCVKSNTQNGPLQKLDYLTPRCSPRSTLSCSCDLPALLPPRQHLPKSRTVRHLLLIWESSLPRLNRWKTTSSDAWQMSHLAHI